MFRSEQKDKLTLLQGATLKHLNWFQWCRPGCLHGTCLSLRRISETFFWGGISMVTGGIKNASKLSWRMAAESTDSRWFRVPPRCLTGMYRAAPPNVPTPHPFTHTHLYVLTITETHRHIVTLSLSLSSLLHSCLWTQLCWNLHWVYIAWLLTMVSCRHPLTIFLYFLHAIFHSVTVSHAVWFLFLQNHPLSLYGFPHRTRYDRQWTQG